MAILLSGVKFKTVTVRLQDFGTTLTPPLGGIVQRINRLGSRYAIDVELPPLPEEPTGRQFTALLEQALTQGATFAVPQLRMTIPSAPSAVVNGAVSGGSSLPIRGLPASYTILAGQYLSIIQGGRRYLHRASADTVANGSGIMAALPILPMLRVALTDASVIEINTPILEGLIDTPSWAIMTEPFFATRFTISEAA